MDKIYDKIDEYILDIIEHKIWPVLLEDGGDIELVGFNKETGVLSVYLKGSCSNCPSSTQTLKGGIEKMLRHYVP